MARRRMLSLDILDSDTFADCSLESRYCYCELTVRADDHGFIGGVNRILRMTGCNTDALTELVNNGLLMRFDSGIYLITDWLVGNRVTPTKMQPTLYEREAAQIRIVGKRYELESETNANCESLLDRSRKGGGAGYEEWESFNNQ